MLFPPLPTLLDDLFLPATDGPDNLDSFLAGFQHIPTGQGHCHVLIVVSASQLIEFILAGRIDKPPNIAPIQRAGAHCAGLPRRNKSARSQVSLREVYGCQSRKLGLCVLDVGDGVVRQQDRGIVGR